MSPHRGSRCLPKRRASHGRKLASAPDGRGGLHIFFFGDSTAPHRITPHRVRQQYTAQFSFIFHFDLMLLLVSLRSFCATDFAVKSNDWCAIRRRRADAQPLTATRCSLGSDGCAGNREQCAVSVRCECVSFGHSSASAVGCTPGGNGGRVPLPGALSWPVPLIKNFVACPCRTASSPPHNEAGENG